MVSNVATSKATKADAETVEIMETPSFINTPPPSVIATSSPGTSSDSSEKLPHIISNYIEGLRLGETDYDTRYGLSVDNDTGKLTMGNAEVKFVGKNISFWRNNKRLGTYRGNPQLYDLLFLKQLLICAVKVME